MKITPIHFMMVILLIGFKISYARGPENSNSTNSNSITNPNRDLAEGCLNPGTSTDLDFNAVKALIHSAGDMWENFSKGEAAYEVPKNSGRHSIYSGSLWMGGLDNGGNLKLAANLYRVRGTDFWPGPLTNPGASISSATCSEYDRHFKITKNEVLEYVGWKNGQGQPGYVPPKSILEWPAHGDPSLGQDYYLAPFYDVKNDGNYNPEDGDYPLYDLNGTIPCGKRKVRLYGDFTLWWVFNDKGNVHTSSSGEPIGLEVRAQAFAFATSDEINLMTFYNYEIINRSTYTLYETYFGQWSDTDLGNYTDDYVGCDVIRGLGYCYNGDANDDGPKGYGLQPPAVGIDFFEGPYQDNDGMDNPGPYDERLAPLGIKNITYAQAKAGKGIPYKGLGVGYGNGIIDDERFGMTAFVYHNNNQDPNIASQFYNYLRSRWPNGDRMTFGGNGINSGVPCNFMFPGDTDPLGWGTDGQFQGNDWTEEKVGNAPNDRRFIEASGPFILEPGAVNDITVGVPWARAISGTPFQSVIELQRADDKAQALFDNCFKIVDGPVAPDVSIQELDRELILYLSNNSPISNNYLEKYEEIDAINIPPNVSDPKYRFQGYQVYQLKDLSVTAGDLLDKDKAQLVFQTDKRDTIGDIINYSYSEGLLKGQNMVPGSKNTGLEHSFRVTEDKFAKGDRRLINHKTYYYMAISYAYNNYADYNPLDPLKLNGQKVKYLSSRRSTFGALKTYSGIPHLISPEIGGSILNSEFGNQPSITRYEGMGNGNNFLDLSETTINEILAKSSNPGYQNSPIMSAITYKPGFGPIKVQVIDPLNVKPDSFSLKFLDTALAPNYPKNDLSNGHWVLINHSDDKVLPSQTSILVGNEQLFLDYGISVNIEQAIDPGPMANNEVMPGNGFIGATMLFADSSKKWLTGVSDQNGTTALNWIRSGTVRVPGNFDGYSYPITPGNPDIVAFFDPKSDFEKVLGGTWAPGRLVSHDLEPGGAGMPEGGSHPGNTSTIKNTASVDLVITKDQTKWTRCPVIELGEDSTAFIGNETDPLKRGVQKLDMRLAPSVGKDGLPDNSLTWKGTPSRGMGWFPGYAINVETGERLNMMFGEDSWLGGEFGNDMLWNPTANLETGFDNTPVMGGKHYIYILGHNQEKLSLSGNIEGVPAYDQGRYVDSLLSRLWDTDATNDYQPLPTDLPKVYKDVMWVGVPLLAPEQELLACDVTIKLRATKSYQRYPTGAIIRGNQALTIGKTYYVANASVKYANVTYPSGDIFTTTDAGGTAVTSPTTGISLSKIKLIETINMGNPVYGFSLKKFAATNKDKNTAKDALDLIRVVPNPYYAYSAYETSQLDNRVKITNLPRMCTVRIYTVDGTLVRELKKDDGTLTSLDWDLKNSANVPISGGVYILHISASGIGEKVIKWFGVLRPVDLQNF